MKDNLGDRIKGYESAFENYFLPRIPIIVRVDGRSFHSWVKKEKCKKPFDDKLSLVMICAAKNVAEEMQNCLGFYRQSDEVTFVMHNESLESQVWFGGRQNKIETIVAGLMTAWFNKYWIESNYSNCFDNYGKCLATPAVFDARAFQCPLSDVPNVILWRAKDWRRNSVNTYCMEFFSHKELQGKSTEERLKILGSIGKSWEKDLSLSEKYGTYFNFDRNDSFEPNYNNIKEFYKL